MNSNKINDIKILAAWAFLIINVSFLLWYQIVGYQPWFHSDSAAKVLLAEEIVFTGEYFPKDWVYVNQDLWVLFGHTFIVPLLWFMQAGYKVHAISGIISSALILLGIWLVSGISNISHARRLIILAVSASGISGFMAENIYGQVSYGSVLYFSCFLIYLYWKYLHPTNQGRKHFLIPALVILTSLLFWANPQRAIIYYGIPLTSALVVYALNCSSEVRARSFRLFLFTMCGVILGFILHSYTLTEVNNVQGAGHARWLAYDKMLDNLSMLPKGVLAMLGGVPTTGAEVLNTRGVFEALRLGTSLLLMVIIPIAIVDAIRRARAGLQFISVFVASSLACTLFILITTTVPDMSDPVSSSRYLTPSIFLGIVALLMSPMLSMQNLRVLVPGACIGILLTTSGYSVAFLSQTNSEYVWEKNSQAIVEQYELLKHLKSKGLRYGYATYWNAGRLSVASNGTINIRQIVINDGLPMPHRHLSSDRWYRPEAWEGKSFLLLTAPEMGALDVNKLAVYGAIPDAIYKIGKFNIIEFKDNISRHMPNWDPTYQSEVSVHITPYSLKQVGHLVEESGHGYALVAEKSESGYLHYGPYLTAAPGRYRAVFNIIANHDPYGVASLDIHEAQSGSVKQSVTLTSSDKPFEMIFDLDQPGTLEFRVHALGKQRIVFRGATLQRIPED
jgi:hypothetical protein